MKQTAYEYLNDFVLNYIKVNFKTIKKNHPGVDSFVDKSIITELENKNPSTLEWVLGEVLNAFEFTKEGIMLERGYGEDGTDLENVHTTIYKIENKYIRERFVYPDVLYPHLFEFVKPVEKTVIIHTYETIQ
jgi:hypothetical protein